MSQNPEEKFQQLLSQKHQNKNKTSHWDELSDLEEQNMEEIKSEQQRPTQAKKDPKPKSNRQTRKASEIQEYQKALFTLRSQCKIFYKPFEKHELNIITMQAIKMLKDALEKDKDFTKALRNMGCKTRMRVRNKTAARELFEGFLNYLESGEIPQWLKNCYTKLMEKDESTFFYDNRIDQKE